MLKNTKFFPRQVMKKNSFYITTTIPYVNADPHIGHALEIVQSDAIARYQRLKGDKVFFLTGVYEHAQKNVQAAEALGISVKEFVDAYEVTPEYQYSFDEDTQKVQVTQKPWEIKDDEGVICNSLMPPPVVVSLIKQLVRALEI
ncbi:MAG: class I tRNA ligase family protein [Patescibacteria group bacterium]